MILAGITVTSSSTTPVAATSRGRRVCPRTASTTATTASTGTATVSRPRSVMSWAGACGLSASQRQAAACAQPCTVCRMCWSMVTSGPCASTLTVRKTSTASSPAGSSQTGHARPRAGLSAWPGAGAVLVTLSTASERTGQGRLE